MSSLEPAHDALLGRRLLGRYRIEAVIARGGMAVVYRGRDERLARGVAIKVLSAPYAGDAEFVDRFLAEARTAAAFSHPNLAHVYDSGSEGEVRFIVMELLERSRSLRQVLRERGRLPPPEAADVVLDVLAGLEPLHAAGLVHCDVKPGNVMIGPDGAKLIDFGIARPLRPTTAGYTSIGSLHTMSPEQLRGDPLTPASDLFAVGVVLFEALTGRVPFPGDSVEEVLAAQDRGPLDIPSRLAPEAHRRLDDVTLQALQRDPEHRFASAAAMAAALRSALRARAAPTADDETTVSMDALAAAPAVAAGPPGRPSGARPVRRLPLIVMLALPALLVAAIVLTPDDSDGAAQPSPTPQPTVQATPTPMPGTVRVPDTIGMSEQEAEAAAREAGLAWRIEWRVVPGQTPGIYDQEPAPGQVVEAGSRFVMYAYRSR